MASSIVEKYEQILAADPRSRIFVELAKALVDRGEHARAVEICQRGLEHHPSSILGRVTWGRALLEAGDGKGAMDQFEIAIALEPSSPYAYNHVGEALLRKGLHREALPVLARAAELQPADARVKGWLEEARKRAKGESWPPPAAPRAKLSLEDEEQTEPFRPINAPRAPPPAAAPVAAARVASPDAAAVSEEGPGGEETPTRTPPVLPRAPATPPPLPPDTTPPPLRLDGERRSVLYMIPGDTREVIGPAAARARKPASVPAPAPDPAEAERIAAQYEREVRERLLSAPAPPPTFFQRHRRLVAATAVALVLGAAAGVYLFVDVRNAEALAQVAASRGRAGLARDTLASLREAHRLLSEARRRSRSDPEVASLAAQVAAVLAVDHGDEDARAVAEKLADDDAIGDGALVAGYLLAAPSQRMSLEPEILAARPSSAPLLQVLAGRILAARGERESGRGRLEIGARSNPPLLRALSDLGELALSAGDAEGALSLYSSALSAHPTHPRSAIGAAEARLALGRDLESSRKELAAVEADEGSAPPRDVRPRFEIAYARVLAGLGESGEAAARLAHASESMGESAALVAALAEIQLAARAWDRAEAAAARAVRLAPREADHRVLLARARIGRGRFAEALAATQGFEGRAIRVQRAIARYRMGQWAQARAELERTAKDGKMPAEAAVWYGLVDVATGRTERALSLLEKLAASPSPPPLAHVALGRALEADRQLADAEESYRAAAAREPGVPEGHLALGRLLLSQGRAAEALPALERGALLDPSDLAARRLLGEARLAAGQPSAARADLDFVLLASPRDAAALRLLSAAWLAEGQPAEARRAADQAVLYASKDPAAHLAAARAALAAKDPAAVASHAERALRLGASGGAAAEARKLRAEAGRGRR